MKGDSFFSDLPPIESFYSVTDTSVYEEIPDDWYLGITDIVNSSEASDIEGYKWVNILGAAPIVGLMNETEREPLPYTFSGDGCAFFVPPYLKEIAEKVLNATSIRGQQAFGLTLRTALIPVSALYEYGTTCRVAKLRTDSSFEQAVFTGGGLTLAENILKDPTDNRFDLIANGDEQADYSGLECRWDEVHNPGFKVFTYLIEAQGDNSIHTETYKEILDQLQSIFDLDEKSNPLTESQLNMSLRTKIISGEINFRTEGRRWWNRIRYTLDLIFRVLMGKLLMSTGTKTRSTDWSIYKKDMIRNSDHRKFDDMLRMVLSGTEDQGKQFEKVLSKLEQDDKVIYGSHISDSALITCMVFDWQDEHLHFIDGGDGGYVQAALDMKRRRML